MSLGLIAIVSQHYDINSEFIEKDYWITLILGRLAKSEYVDSTVFKGGTSLSKGYNTLKSKAEIRLKLF